MDTFALAQFQVLAIPDIMYTYAYISRVIAIVLIPLLLILNESNFIIESAKGTTNTNPSHGFVRIILIIIGLFTFKYLFMKIVALFEAIAMSLCDATDWWVFREKLAATGEQYSTSLLKINVQKAITVVSIILAGLVEIILNVVRFVLLSILYVLGPLALVSGIYIKTASLLRGWFTNVIQISFWVVMLRLVQSVFLSLDVVQTLNNGSMIEYIMVSSVLIVLILSIPALSARIMSGQNIGLIGSAAIGLASVGTIKYATRVRDFAKDAFKHTGKGLGNVYRGAAGGVAGGTVLARTIKKDGIVKASTAGVKHVGKAVKKIHRRIIEKPKR